MSRNLFRKIATVFAAGFLSVFRSPFLSSPSCVHREGMLFDVLCMCGTSRKQQKLAQFLSLSLAFSSDSF